MYNVRLEHLCCQVRLLLYHLKSELRTFVDLEVYNLLHLDQLPLF